MSSEKCQQVEKDVTTCNIVSRQREKGRGVKEYWRAIHSNQQNQQNKLPTKHPKKYYRTNHSEKMKHVQAFTNVCN